MTKSTKKLKIVGGVVCLAGVLMLNQAYSFKQRDVHYPTQLNQYNNAQSTLKEIELRKKGIMENAAREYNNQFLRVSQELDNASEEVKKEIKNMENSTEFSRYFKEKKENSSNKVNNSMRILVGSLTTLLGGFFYGIDWLENWQNKKNQNNLEKEILKTTA